MTGGRVIRVAALVAAAVGGLSGGAYGLLSEQSRRARRLIGRPKEPPPHADGWYRPTGPVTGAPLRFAVLGDSSAAGLGVTAAEQLPAVLLAGGLAERSGRPVLLTTYAISGATTRGLPAQVDRALAGQPDLALVIIGANDVTTRMRVHQSANILAVEVRRLRAAGAAVVVGTCPDLGAIRPIPQPLRSVARRWSLLLAGAQRGAVRRAGGIPVALADLLSPTFMARASELFSADRFHPNAAGYAAAAAVLLGPLCEAVGLPPDPVTAAPAPTPTRPRWRERAVTSVVGLVRIGRRALRHLQDTEPALDAALGGAVDTDIPTAAG